MPLLRVRNLACERGERLVFSGIDFSLEAGEALHLTGPNGSGKSSLLRLLAGLLVPLRGEISWNNTPIVAEWMEHRRRLSYQGHLDGLKSSLSVGANLAFWSELLGSTEAMGAILDRLGIGPLAGEPVRHLSAGQRRRVALARLLLKPGRLWLLDEPANALDAAGQALLGDLIGAHLAAGGIAIIASHDDIRLDKIRRLNLAGAQA